MSDKSKLMRYAIDYLSKFSSSKANLEKILKNKIRRLNIEKKDKFLLYNSIEEIISKLEKNNLINDSLYSLSKIRSFVFQGKSKLYIKSYFFQKGIDKQIIDDTFEDYESDNPQWELESAKTFARKKRLSNIDDKEKKLSKMAQAGFNYEISKKTIDQI